MNYWERPISELVWWLVTTQDMGRAHAELLADKMFNWPQVIRAEFNRWLTSKELNKDFTVDGISIGDCLEQGYYTTGVFGYLAWRMQEPEVAKAAWNVPLNHSQEVHENDA